MQCFCSGVRMQQKLLSAAGFVPPPGAQERGDRGFGWCAIPILQQLHQRAQPFCVLPTHS
jgi:hypothetical protein